MEYNKNNAHYIVVTGIIVKDNKFLIAKRGLNEKAFPGRWTVPGGKFEMKDYINRKKDTPHHWYNVLEDALKREVLEEAGIEIKNIGYVTSMVYIRDDNIPCLIISLFAELKNENPKIKLCEELIEYKWVDINEAKEYDLIEGIFDELVILDNYLKNGNQMVWEKKE